MLILAGTLPRPRFDVQFILLSGRGRWADDAEAMGVPVHVLDLPKSVSPRHPRAALDAVRAILRYRRLTQRVDIVDAWLVPAFTFAGLLRPLAAVPILVAGRRSLLDLSANKPWYRRAAAALATRQVNVIVANSQITRRETIEREGVHPDQVVWIPNAVLPISSDPAERDRWRRAWALHPGDLVVGCVANYKPGKGLETILQAAAVLRGREPRLRYVLIGEGPLRGPLERRIEAYGLGAIVTLVGAVDDARQSLAAFDIAIQASRSEGLPNAILESAAAGLPIIATAVGGTMDVIDSPNVGMLVPPDDPDALATEIFRLANDPALRQTMGNAARARSETFTAARLATSTAALYERLHKLSADG